MSRLDDYINELEGKTDIDPLEVASKLLALHNEEIGVREAKISQLDGIIAERDNVIAERETELTAQKAKNFDLAMQIPGVKTPNDADRQEEQENITIDDLFKR